MGFSLSSLTRHALVALLLALLLATRCSGMRSDCCMAKWTGLGGGCSIEGTAIGNITYYCVTVAESCSTCAMAANTTSSSCYQCCADEPSACGLPFSYISTSSWSEYARPLPIARPLPLARRLLLAQSSAIRELPSPNTNPTNPSPPPPPPPLPQRSYASSSQAHAAAARSCSCLPSRYMQSPLTQT